MPTNLKALHSTVATAEVDFHGVKFNVQYYPVKITRKSLDNMAEEETLAESLVKVCVGWDLVQTVEVEETPAELELTEENPSEKLELTDENASNPETKAIKRSKAKIVVPREEPVPFTAEVLDDLGYDLCRVIWKAIIEGRSPNATKSSA